MGQTLQPLPCFEDLARLAHDDPSGFEALRREIVDDFIDHAPARLHQRLRGIQFRVDGTRQLAHDGLDAAQQVFAMMRDSFDALAGHWRTLPDELRGRPRGEPVISKATVISLEERRAALRRTA